VQVLVFVVFMLDERQRRRRNVVLFLVLTKDGAVGGAQVAHGRKLPDAERAVARHHGGPQRGGGGCF
jgi:hypothetical protein